MPYAQRYVEPQPTPHSRFYTPDYIGPRCTPTRPIMAGTRLLTRAFNARPIHPVLSLSHQSQYSINHLWHLATTPAQAVGSLFLKLLSRCKVSLQSNIPIASERCNNNIRSEGTSPSIHAHPVPRIHPSLLLPPPIPFHPAFHPPRVSPKPRPFRLSCLSSRLATLHLLTFWL